MPSSYTTPAGRFVDTSQARANAAAFNYACQQARNQRQTNCAQPTGDMPLDQAVYVPAVGPRAAFIAGVRGGYVFNLDATTGAKVSQSRFAAPVFGPSSICYDTSLDKLFVSLWTEGHSDFTPEYSPRGIYQLSPSTLATEVFSAWNVIAAGLLPAFAPLFGASLGPRYITAVNGTIYGMAVQNSTPQPPAVVPFWWPRSGAVVVPSDGTLYSGSLWNQCANDGTYLYIGDRGNSVNKAPLATIGTGATWVGGALPWDASDYGDTCGMCPDSDGAVWVTTGSKFIYKMAADLASGTAITLPDADAQVLWVRFNPADGLVYAPSLWNNKIYAIASDGGFLVKSGFDSPFDMVFTPTNKWAVQQGAVGLKEIV